jgi:hypothetical protein
MGRNAPQGLNELHPYRNAKAFESDPHQNDASGKLFSRCTKETHVRKRHSYPEFYAENTVVDSSMERCTSHWH